MNIKNVIMILIEIIGGYVMNVSKIGMVNCAPLKKVSFGDGEAKTEKQPEKQAPAYENPISRKAEKGLATLAVVGGSAVFGAIIAGLATCIPQVGKKWALIAGAGAAVLAAAITLPSKLYNTAVNAFTREKEMDVYSRDKALKTNLTEEVHKEVLDPEVSLDKKLDDNLKLQTANRAQALIIQH